MTKINFKILINKNGKKLLIWIIGVIVTIWLSSLLSPIFDGFNKLLIEKSKIPIIKSLTTVSSFFNIMIPIYIIFVFLLVIYLLFKGYEIITLSFRKFKILKAEYGSGITFIDITNQLNNYVVDNKLNLILSNAISGFDPTPNVRKIAKITYEFNKKQNTINVTEREKIVLP